MTNISRDFRYVSAASAALLASVLLLHNVATVYTGNVEEFSFGLSHIYIFLIPLFLLTWFLLAGPAILLKGTALKVYAVTLSFLGILAWIYSNFIVLDFGLLDGRQLRFDLLKDYRVGEAVAIVVGWFVFGFALIRLPRVFLSFVVILNIGLWIPTAWALVSDTKDATLEERANLDAVYRFSKRQNVLIVLMDSFQSDIFADLLEQNPKLSAQMTGFTFFPNTLGIAPTTYMTMPSVHSGRPFTPEQMLQQFYYSQVYEGSFLNALAQAGHEVTLINPIQQTCPKKIELCLPIREILRSKWQVLFLEAARLLDLSFFRALPIRYKESIYGEEYWLLLITLRSISVDIGYQDHHVLEGNLLLEAIASRAAVTTDRPVTKFIHLLNTHIPYVLDSNCKIAEKNLLDRRLAASVQAKCAVDAFLKLTARLKREGIYDQALILLVADTGAALPSSYVESDLTVPDGWARFLGGANPIFLVKPPGAKGPLRQSIVDVQLSDIPATVCDVIGTCVAEEGLSALNATGMPPRIRRYNFYRWHRKYSGKDVIPNVVQYNVKGPIWDFRSWIDFQKAAPN